VDSRYLKCPPFDPLSKTSYSNIPRLKFDAIQAEAILERFRLDQAQNLIDTELFSIEYFIGLGVDGNNFTSNKPVDRAGVCFAHQLSRHSLKARHHFSINIPCFLNNGWIN